MKTSERGGIASQVAGPKVKGGAQDGLRHGVVTAEISAVHPTEDGKQIAWTDSLRERGRARGVVHRLVGVAVYEHERRHHTVKVGTADQWRTSEGDRRRDPVIPTARAERHPEGGHTTERVAGDADVSTVDDVAEAMSRSIKREDPADDEADVAWLAGDVRDARHAMRMEARDRKVWSCHDVPCRGPGLEQ